MNEEHVRDAAPAVIERRKVAASAAEDRKRESDERGIGNMHKVRRMEKASAANAQREIQNTPAAARAERLQNSSKLKRKCQVDAEAPSSTSIKNKAQDVRPSKTHASSSSSSSIRITEPTTLATPATTVGLAAVSACSELLYTSDAPVDNTMMPRGLKNLGNTCYGNACLFALTSILPVRRWAHEHLHVALKPPAHRDDSCVLCMLGRDIEQLSLSLIHI